MAYFSDLTINDRVAYTKREFSALIKTIFENPETLKSFINDKKLSNDQAKVVLKTVDTLNSKSCGCCRRFDPTKLQLTPIVAELEPILDIAQTNVKARSY